MNQQSFWCSPAKFYTKSVALSVEPILGGGAGNTYPTLVFEVARRIEGTKQYDWQSKHQFALKPDQLWLLLSSLLNKSKSESGSEIAKLEQIKPGSRKSLAFYNDNGKSGENSVLVGLQNLHVPVVDYDIHRLVSRLIATIAAAEHLSQDVVVTLARNYK